MHIETKELRKALKVFALLNETKIKFEVRGKVLHISNTNDLYNFKAILCVYVDTLKGQYSECTFASLEIEVKSLLNFLKIIRSEITEFRTISVKGNRFLDMPARHLEHSIYLKDVNNKEIDK